MRPKKITARGETHTVREWATRAGITRAAMYLRLSHLPVEEAVKTARDRRIERLIQMARRMRELESQQRLCLLEFCHLIGEPAPPETECPCCGQNKPQGGV